MSLYRYAIVTAVATFALLLVGGTVNPTGSSLACPDWPLCFGSLFPELKDGVQYEHTHRLAATLVGLMTIVLAVWIARARREDRALVRLGFVALALVIAQGVLGGVTVLLELPLLVSVAHLALSMAFQLLLVWLCFRLWSLGAARAPSVRAASPLPPARLRPAATPARAARVPRALPLAIAGTYLQILLGAFVRHSRAGRACGDDWLLCSGALWPPLHPAQLHMLHRVCGILVLVLVAAAAVAAARRARARGQELARAVALAAPAIAVAQIVIGALLVRSSIGLGEAVAHTGLAALLLADLYLVQLALAAQPATSPAPLPLRGPTVEGET